MTRVTIIGILSMLLLGACQCNAPPISVELTPVKACNPTTYPSIPNVTSLFEDAEGERVCLTLIFQHDTREIRAFAPALLTKDGTMVGYDSSTKTFTGSVKLSNPKEVFEDAKTNPWKVSMRLYFLAHNTDKTGRQEAHLEFCKKTGIKDYQCPSPTEPSCWFSMQVPPSLPKDSAYKLETTTKACAPCTPEICNNQKDDDCDGLTDDDPECSACKKGQTRACFTVAGTLRNVGSCRDGTQTCVADSKWGKCEGEVTNKAEACNSADDDCDGLIDEDLKDCCDPGSVRNCYAGDPKHAGRGICEQGIEVCTKVNGSGKWSGTCIGGTQKPKDEICNSTDDNCDGLIDESLTEKCYTGKISDEQNNGECKAGTRVCQTNGQWSSCKGEQLPVDEICDGKDNNCDGKVDNEPKMENTPCSVPGEKGPCAAGTMASCENGQPACVSTFTKKTNELCVGDGVGVDDNCDGNIDETCGCKDKDTQSCYKGDPLKAGVGACTKGTQTCNSQKKWSLCTGGVEPTSEQCDNIDNDCNGTIDENLVRPCYSGPQGSAGKGPCKEGSQTCSTGQWSACVGEVKPSPEVCNQKDDNCDGNIDETCECQPAQKESCYNGPSNTEKIGTCKSGQRTCNAQGKWGPCIGEVKPTSEICDNEDNDCDGRIDNSLSRKCYGGPASTKNIGSCREGTETCNAGKWGACQGEQQPVSPDGCDGKDNDCDGETDEDCKCQEGLKQDCYSGPSGTVNVGICRAGSQTCTGGVWGSCSGEKLPTVETCNNKDDDCDGSVDDNLTRSCYGGPSGTENNAPCKSGTETCNAGKWDKCNGEVKPKDETCNGIDDDCDGQTDNIANSTNPLTKKCPYTGAKGTKDKGVCKEGAQVCQNNRWSACTGEIIPSEERCNNLDDDCDGQVDEPHPVTHCNVGCPPTFDSCNQPNRECLCQ